MKRWRLTKIAVQTSDRGIHVYKAASFDKSNLKNVQFCNMSYICLKDSSFTTVLSNSFIFIRAVQVFTGAIYGEGSGPIFMDQLFCRSYDVELESCRYLYLNSCTHEMDVSVVCNGLFLLK